MGGIFVEERPRPRIMWLIKFIDRQWSDQFRSGRIRLGSVASFSKEHSLDLSMRQDINENLSFVYKLDRSILHVNDFEISDTVGSLEVRFNVDVVSYLFCMTAVTDWAINAANGSLRLDSRLAQLGDSAVIVTNVSEFLRRLKSKIEELDSLRSTSRQSSQLTGLVEYVDLCSYHGEVGLFRKSSEFAFQNEWRLALEDTAERALDEIFLEIGDLTDITKVMTSKDLLECKFGWTPKPGSKPLSEA